MSSQRRSATTGQVSRLAASRDGDDATLALLVGLAPPDEDVDALLHESEVLDIEGRELGTAEAAGEAQEEHRPVADGEEVVLGSRVQHGLQRIEPDRCYPPLPRAAPSGDAGHNPANELVVCW